MAETPETCELPSCIGDTTETGVDGLETTICVDNAQAYYPNVALVGGPNRLEQENVAGSLVVHDRVSGLTWTGCPSGLTGNRCQTGTLQSKSYSQQQNYCRDLNWAGHTDWFAPTDADWRSILNQTVSNTALDPAVFPEHPEYVIGDRYNTSNQNYIHSTSWGVLTYSNNPHPAYCIRRTDGMLRMDDENVPVHPSTVRRCFKTTFGAAQEPTVVDLSSA